MSELCISHLMKNSRSDVLFLDFLGRLSTWRSLASKVYGIINPNFRITLFWIFYPYLEQKLSGKLTHFLGLTSNTFPALKNPEFFSLLRANNTCSATFPFFSSNTEQSPLREGPGDAEDPLSRSLRASSSRLRFLPVKGTFWTTLSVFMQTTVFSLFCKGRWNKCIGLETASGSKLWDQVTSQSFPLLNWKVCCPRLWQRHGLSSLYMTPAEVFMVISYASTRLNLWQGASWLPISFLMEPK